jgi:sigma-B regulation protein RsbU (phosphoserine phosphatase)
VALKLVGTDGKRYYSWDLEPGKYVIGRKHECDFCVPDNTVSRNHAEIEVSRDGDHLTLSDLGSHNGTMLNGSRIEGRVQIEEGDQIMFGQTEFKIAPSEESAITAIPTKTRLSDDDPQNSVFLSIDDALRPLPTKVTERPELLPTLFEMAKMLVLPEPQERMLQRSLAMISKIIPAERLAVLFVSEDNDEVYTAASLLTSAKDPGAFTLSRTIVNEIISNKNAILICDPRHDPRFAQQQSIIMSEMKSAIAVPLFDEGKVLGVLYADTSSPAHQYDNDYLRVLATFGNIIASRILNYALLAERQEKHLLDAELKRASAIQKNLLVEVPSRIPGYEICACLEQSRSVGGDLYDMKMLQDGRVVFLVADVSGKGLGAALLMSNILASFRILYESEEFDLIGSVEKISLQMHRYSASGDFATLFIGVTDPTSNLIRFVNAGHNPPVLVRGDGEMEHLDSSGTMIGAFDFCNWTQDSVEMSDGDLLLVFSDGVTEAQKNGDQYGDERMEGFLLKERRSPVRQIVDGLMGDIDEFMGDAPRSDDITMLIVKRAEK